MVFKFFGLIFLAVVLATIIPVAVKAQESCPEGYYTWNQEQGGAMTCRLENMSFSGMVAKRQALQAEQDALGQQWQENQKKLDNMGVQYEALDAQITDGLGRLGPLKAEAETLMRDFERKLPEFKRREAALEGAKEQLENEVEIYYSACDVTVLEEEYPQKFADCQARYAKLEAALERNVQDFEQLNREVQTLNQPVDRAIEVHDNLLANIKGMEAQQQSLVTEGAALETANEELVQAGVELDVQIEELDRLILQQNDAPVGATEYAAATGEAFTEGQTLTERVEATNWPMKAKATFLLGVLMANRGSYDQAIAYFQTALQTVPNEPWIAATIDYIRGLQAEQAVRKGSGPIAQGMIDPATLGYLPKAARDRILIAMSLVDVGDFGGALGLLNEARRAAPTDQDIRGAETYVSQLLAQKQERESPLTDEEKKARVVAARAKGRRDAAWGLGLHLSDYGNNDGAAARKLLEGVSKGDWLPLFAEKSCTGSTGEGACPPFETS